MMLVLDQYKVQKTLSVQTMLKDECNTITVLVLPGCISLVQPLNVVFNSPFKQAVDTLATSHMEAHVSDYLHGNFTAGERRILLTKWLGQAWEEVSTDKDAVVRGFKKCKISVAVNGAEDDEINIKGFENYKVESDDDPFATSDDSDSSTDNDSLISALISGDEIEEDGLNSSDEEDNGENFSSDVLYHLLYYLIQLPLKNSL